MLVGHQISRLRRQENFNCIKIKLDNEVVGIFDINSAEQAVVKYINSDYEKMEIIKSNKASICFSKEI